ncbi:hypothetical protein Dimus_005817 [Dionaea muscipula]
MAMDVPPVKEDGDTFKVPEEKLMTCASNFEDNTFDMGRPSIKPKMAPSENKELEINIIDCSNSGEKEVVKREYQDATESSSSFGDTDSGIASSAALGDVEVESRCREEGTSMLSFDGLDDLFRIRKKKLTSHWRKFIRPLMWRCKWVELHIKELQSQASKYDGELAQCEERKLLELQRLTAEDLHVKSVPTLCQNQRKNIMRRKRRKRVEETVDIESYMTEHNLFSYYVNKRSVADAGYMDDNCPTLGAVVANRTLSNNEFVNGEWTPLEFKHGGSFEEILQKIGEAQTQLNWLRARMSKVICENTVKLPSPENLCLLAPNDALTSSAARLELPFMNGDTKGGACSTAFFPASDPKAAEQVIHERAVSSYGEVAPLPDMIEGIDQPVAGISCEKIEGPTLVYDPCVKQELHSFKDVVIKHIPAGKPQSPYDQQAGSADPLTIIKHELPSETTVAGKQPSLKSRSISKSATPKSKKKRGRRKAASSRWNRKSSG